MGAKYGTNTRQDAIFTRVPYIFRAHGSSDFRVLPRRDSTDGLLSRAPALDPYSSPLISLITYRLPAVAPPRTLEPHVHA